MNKPTNSQIKEFFTQDDFASSFEIQNAVQDALSFAKKEGSAYAELRLVKQISQQLSVKSGKPEAIQEKFNLGFGIRVLCSGCWGFAASCEISPENMIKKAKEAVQNAKAVAALAQKPFNFPPQPAQKAVWITPVKINPFKIPIEEKIEKLLAIEKILKESENVFTSQVQMEFLSEQKLFCNSEGSLILQHIIHSGAGGKVMARKDHQMVSRSFPASQGGQTCASGYELIQSLNLEHEAEKTAQEVQELLTAKECPEGEFTVIIEGSHLSLMIHETIGHALELDRVFGAEENFSGTSFATPDKLRKLKYASQIVNVVADATAEGGLGSFGFDDEGQPAQKIALIQNGLLVGYHSNRQTSARIGENSSAAARAQDWSFNPIVRMTNTNLLPGKSSLEEIIADTKEGFYIATTSSWSIDDKRENFKFATELGWKIKDGKLTEMVKKPTYTGNTLDFWNKCDAIANSESYKIWGTPNCGKGQPAQNGRVSQGCSPARFQKIKFGG